MIIKKNQERIYTQRLHHRHIKASKILTFEKRL